MKYLLPLVLGLLVATHTPVFAQGDEGEAYSQQDADTSQPATGSEGEPDVTANEPASVEEEQGKMQQMQDLANKYKEQYGDQTPSVEDMKSFADKYDIKPPSADAVRNFATQHQGQVDKALDYAKQFQEFRREQREESQTGSMAPE
jgi:hypothetical protein